MYRHCPVLSCCFGGMTPSPHILNNSESVPYARHFGRFFHRYASSFARRWILQTHGGLPLATCDPALQTGAHVSNWRTQHGCFNVNLHTHKLSLLLGRG